MNRPSSSPVALCARSMRAGQWLLRGRSARPTPAITSLLLLMPSPSLCSDLDQVPVPVDGDAELVAERLGVLLIEDGRPRTEPHSLQNGHGEGRPVVDGEVVLRLIRSLLARRGIDGIPSP